MGSEMTPPLSDFCQKKNIHIYMVWQSSQTSNLIWGIQRIAHIEKSIFITNNPLLLAAGRELFFMSMRVKFEYTGPFKTPWHTKCKLYLNSLAIQIFTKKNLYKRSKNMLLWLEKIRKSMWGFTLSYQASKFKEVVLWKSFTKGRGLTDLISSFKKPNMTKDSHIEHQSAKIGISGEGVKSARSGSNCIDTEWLL